HMQQGGNPSPFDRTLAVRMVHKATSWLYEELSTIFNRDSEANERQGNGHERSSVYDRNVGAVFVGQFNGSIQSFPVSHMDELIDMENRLPYDPWWLGLEDVLYVVSNPNFKKELGVLPIVINDGE
ncbi:MAG: hypothetical protein SPG61_05160, partial [Arcanobacterium sp.]|nr:hypothetical protein [Arcanobacterium sp.]